MRRREGAKPPAPTSSLNEALEDVPSRVHAPEQKEMFTDPPPPPKESEKSRLDSLAPGRGVDRIVRTIFDLPEPHEEFEALRWQIRNDGRITAMSHGELVDALGQSLDIAQRAAELLAVYKAEADDFEITSAQQLGSYEEQAQQSLAAAKERGEYNGRFSMEDVKKHAAKMFPTDYRAISRTQSEVKRGVDAVESLYDRCVDRVRNLRAIVSTSRAE